MSKLLKRGTPVVQVMPAPFRGVIREYRMDPDTGDRLVVVAAPVIKNGQIETVESLDYDLVQAKNDDGTLKFEPLVDEQGNKVLDASGKEVADTRKPVWTDERTNVRKTQVPVVEERVFREEEIELDPDAQ